MGVTLLPSTQALTPGADLWVVGKPETSAWALRLDWALNFQIMQVHERKVPNLNSTLNQIVLKSELALPPMQNNPPSTPLLIPAEKALPCRWVLSLAEFDLKQLRQLVSLLKPVQIRVFLPNSISAQKLATEWNELFSQVDLQLVEN